MPMDISRAEALVTVELGPDVDLGAVAGRLQAAEVPFVLDTARHDAAGPVLVLKVRCGGDLRERLQQAVRALEGR